MAFKPICQYGERIPTVKGSEKILVQLVDLSNDKTGLHSLRVEARILFQKSDGDYAPSKTAIAFSDADDMRLFADTLHAAADDAVSKGLVKNIPTLSAPTPPAIPVVAINRGGKAVRARAARAALDAS